MKSQQHLIDYDYILPNNIQFWPIGVRPNSYKLISSVHRREEVIQDNLGYVYFRSKLMEKKYKLYQGLLLLPEGTFVEILFSNIEFIKTIQCELQNVKIAGCDSTFKTVPKTLDGDCYQLYTFQIIYKNLSFPLVYALLNGKTEEIYVALFKFTRQIVPFNYHNVIIITDFELAQMNAIKSIFKESVHQGCYFHFCKAVLRYLRSKKVGIYNLVKTNNIAARIFRMILALPYLPPDRNGQMPNMLDGFNAILICIIKYPELADAFHSFLHNYVFGFWFVRIRPERFTVFNKTIRTNNYVKSFHAALLIFIKLHLKIWEFIGIICSGVSSRARELNTLAINNFIEQLLTDNEHDMVQTFLRRAGHRVDEYITQQIGSYPNEQELLLEEATEVNI
ncbi:uncharacterized protein LOC113560039 [Rhopalosiphum maidis]|uniref:uncharacterized protein LOC113560039 n=1 Tax=Rhopalosiphum maidis TaxID=43146 RepID=UPI000EFEBCF9|nr:uncharacterized protein LOC113560039 [Rhopalosiphum maidis]